MPPANRFSIGIVLLTTILCTQVRAEQRTPLSQDALLTLMKANDQQRQNRLLVVERSGVDKTIPIPYWKYPELEKLVDKTKPIPETISYRFREEFLSLGEVVAFRKQLLESDAPSDSVMRLDPQESWSNRGGIVRQSTGPQNETVFTIRKDQKSGPAAAGLWRLTETELSLGIGYAPRLKHIRKFEIATSETGEYVLDGVIEFIPNANYDAELRIDRDLIVRHAKLSSSSDVRGITLEFKSTGLIRDPHGVNIAESGTFRRTDTDRVPGTAPSGEIESPAGAAPEVTARPTGDFNVRFVSLSELMTKSEFDAFTKVEPELSAQIVDPEQLVTPVTDPKRGLPKARNLHFLFWLNLAAVVALAAVWYRRPNKRAKNA